MQFLSDNTETYIVIACFKGTRTHFGPFYNRKIAADTVRHLQRGVLTVLEAETGDLYMSPEAAQRDHNTWVRNQKLKPEDESSMWLSHLAVNSLRESTRERRIALTESDDS